MNKIIAGGLVAIMLTGCMTQKRLNRICKLCPNETRIDSFVTTTVRDSAIFDTIITPPDSAWFKAWIKCKDGSTPVIYREKSKQGKRTVLTASIDSLGVLTAKCNEDSLVNVIQSNQRTIDRMIQVAKENQIKVSDSRRFNDFFYYMGAAFSILLLFSLLIIILNKYL
jgi:hypothetical protein